MKNILLLTKVGLLSSFSVKGKGKRRPSRLIYLISCVLLLALVGYYGDMLCKSIALFNPSLVLTIGAGAGMMIAFFLGLAKTPGALFSAKDFEMLSALPVSFLQLFASKLAIVYSFAFSSVGMVLVPIAVVYALNFGFTVSLLLATLVTWIFAPMLCAAVGGLISLVISLIASRFRSTNAMMTVLTVLLTLGIIAVSFLVGFADQDSMLHTLSQVSDLFGFLPPVTLYVNAAAGNPGALLASAAVCLVPFAVFAVLCAGIFRKVNLRLGEKHMRADYKVSRLKGLKASSVKGALFRREVKLFTSISAYVMNAITSPLMALVIAGLYFFGLPSLLPANEVIPDADLLIRQLIIPLYLAMAAFIIGTSTTTSCSISVEGDRLWILKSLPVKPTTIFMSKIKLQLMLSVPVSLLISLACVAVSDPGSIPAVVGVFLVPLLYTLAIAMADLIVNLLSPNLTWKNPAVAIKKGSSNLICMVLNWVILAPPVAMYLLLTPSLGALLTATSAYLAVLCAAAWIWLSSAGAKRFAAL